MDCVEPPWIGRESYEGSGMTVIHCDTCGCVIAYDPDRITVGGLTYELCRECRQRLMRIIDVKDWRAKAEAA